MAWNDERAYVTTFSPDIRGVLLHLPEEARVLVIPLSLDVGEGGLNDDFNPFPSERRGSLFVQIGLVPNTEFLKGTIELSRFGEVLVDERCATSAPGIFAAGDATTVPYKQIVIAAGEGAKAALGAFDHLIRQPATPPEPGAGAVVRR